MIQATHVEVLNKVRAGKERIQLQSLINPDLSKLTDMRLLNDLLPSEWTEQVFEYDDRYYVRLSIAKQISKTDEFDVVNLVNKELGVGNIILPTAYRNTETTSTISLQLKKPNYKEEVLANC